MPHGAVTGRARRILSQLTRAINYTSVYYNDTTGNRMVKGPLGNVETYKFTRMQGMPKVKEIDRAANVTHDVRGGSRFTYNSNGYRDSRPTGTAITPRGRTIATASRPRSPMPVTTTNSANHQYYL